MLKPGWLAAVKFALFNAVKPVDQVAFLLAENESAFAPVGIKHSLENLGTIFLEMIKVRSDSYQVEDDGLRFVDHCGPVLVFVDKTISVSNK